ncbi:acyltransferase [Methylomonas methanica]|uniref:Acyltransferase n=1 Tax=Methylomonas methanica TaxID=421 RepID=A0A177MKW7_METMH|nr:lysophospholipid acyltransferase family protein [Methylomonas methanica]OAI06064.1 acyltransferase [Methylomonas methanica]
MANILIKKIDFGWRLLATAISFTSFGIGGVMLWLLVFPLLAIWPGNRAQKAGRAQYTVHLSFYVFIGLMHRLGVMTYEVIGLEKLNRPRQLIVANHPTLVDVVFLLSRIKQANCIVKASLWHNPAMRGPILNAGYISNADSETMINDCATWLQNGGAMIIFPEGTRSVPGQAYRFQRGAAAIALQADSIITPVTLTCMPSTLTKTQAWYQIPQQRFHLRMIVGDDIQLQPFRELQPRSIAVRRLTQYLQDYFTQQRERHERDGN